MTAINHALTGALIGFTVTNPALALPLALLSHFVCDAIPHFGAATGSELRYLRSRRFTIMLGIDALLCMLLVLALALTQPINWILVAVCAFIATSPDFAWLPKYLRARRNKSLNHQPNLYARFAKDIQWFEKPIGALVEAAWLIGSITLLVAYL